MRVDVYQLPGQALAVQSFSKRGEAPYLDAHEELRSAVVKAFAHEQPREPFERVSLTIICYVGSNKRDGYYRAQRVHTLHYTLDPIYRALQDAGVIASMEAIYDIRTCLVRQSSREGFRVQVDELPTARESSPAPQTKAAS